MAHEDPGPSRSLETDMELHEIVKMESQINILAQKIIYSRTKLSDQLKTKFSSILSSQRPVLSLFEPGSGSGPGPGPLTCVVSDAEKDIETSEKVNVLKQKIASNESAMHIVLKRLNECISRSNKLDSCNTKIILPALKKKRTS